MAKGSRVALRCVECLHLDGVGPAEWKLPRTNYLPHSIAYTALFLQSIRLEKFGSAEMSKRLDQITSHLLRPSISAGPVDSALLTLTLGDQLRSSVQQHPNKLAVVSHWQKRRLTYSDLDQQSSLLARALLARGISKGDRVAILAGNCVEYVVFFYAAAKIGAICVVLNPAYTEVELAQALSAVGVKLLVISVSLGIRSLRQHINHVKTTMPEISLIPISKPGEKFDKTLLAFDSLATETQAQKSDDDDLKALNLDQHDIVNIQFTSG